MGSAVAPLAGAALAAGAVAATGGAALPILMAAGAGAGAAGAIQGGYATNAADKANATLATENAGIATQNANWAGAEGEANAAKSEMATRANFGATKAAQGASGLDVNSGSAVKVQQSEGELGELNAMTIRSNAARQAYGYQTTATGDIGQASIDKAEGKNAITQGYIKGATTLGSAAAGAYESGAIGGGDTSGGTFLGSGSSSWNDLQNNQSLYTGLQTGVGAG